MRIRCLVILMTCLGLAGIPGALAQSQYGFHLVAHAQNPADSLTREAVSRLFLSTRPRWEDGNPAEPVDQEPRLLLRDLFSRLVHEETAAEVVRDWQRLEVSAGATPPPQLLGDRKVLDYIRSHPAAVGYVSADVKLGADVKVLKIADLEEPTRVMLVLDLSGSMSSMIGGRRKIDVARDAISQLLVDWDPLVHLGLTAYSHRDGGCDDVETVVPVGLTDPAEVRRTVGALEPKGSTPLTLAVLHAARTLGYRQAKARVILVSDGQETCGLDPCQIGRQLASTSVDFKAFVIGFGVGAAVQDQLRCLAHPTGGDFAAADDARSLQRALEEALARALGEVTQREDDEDGEDVVAFQYVPPGRFEMGSPPEEEGRDSDEKLHEVTLTRGLYVSETEVTRGAWRKVMGTDPSQSDPCGEEVDECPADRVSWYDALAFVNLLSERDGFTPCYELQECQGAPGGGCADDKKECAGDYVCRQVAFSGLDCPGYRLPTEAEWEYAARAETSTPYFQGTELTRFEANLDSREERRYYPRPAEVRSFSPNLWGLHDTHGNVWEWVWDRTVAYPEEPVTDPVDAATVKMELRDALQSRGLRGGSFSDEAEDCRSANRHGLAPDHRRSGVGLRVVRSVE